MIESRNMLPSAQLIACSRVQEPTCAVARLPQPQGDRVCVVCNLRQVSENPHCMLIRKFPEPKDSLCSCIGSSTVSVHQHLPDALEHFTTIASCLAVLEFFSSAQSVASLLIGADTPAPQRRLLSDPFTWSIFLIGDCGKPPGVTIQIEMAKSCALGSGFSGIPKGSR